MSAPYWSDGQVTLYHGDSLEVIPSLGPVDAVVTDPPYGLEFMGREWDSFKPSGARIRERVDGRTNPREGKSVTRTPESYVAGAPYQAWCEQWAAECLRVLRPGGYLLAFGGTRTCHRLVCAIEDAGFEIRDSLHWIYGSGFPKGRACLKPGHEPIVLARKPAAKSAPLNIDACRIGSDESTSRPRGTFPHSDDAWGNGRPSEVSVSHPAGRWPPNILLTHSADCQPIGLREIRNHGHGPAARGQGGISTSGHRGQDGLTERREPVETVEAWDCAPDCPVAELDRQSAERPKRGAGHFPRETSGTSIFGTEGHANGASRDMDSGGASRFYPTFRYQAKAPVSERPRLPDGTAWPTVKPLALMRWLVRLITPPGGTVLDPFAGTGTTGEACALEGFQCVLVERDPTALALARLRLTRPVQTALEAV